MVCENITIALTNSDNIISCRLAPRGWRLLLAASSSYYCCHYSKQVAHPIHNCYACGWRGSPGPLRYLGEVFRSSHIRTLQVS